MTYVIKPSCDNTSILTWYSEMLLEFKWTYVLTIQTEVEILMCNIRRNYIKITSWCSLRCWEIYGSVCHTVMFISNNFFVYITTKWVLITLSGNSIRLLIFISKYLVTLKWHLTKNDCHAHLDPWVDFSWCTPDLFCGSQQQSS